MPRSVTRFLWTWLPLALYTGLIFSLSSIQAIPINLSFSYADKLLHGLEYFIFAFLLMRALLTVLWNRTAAKTLLLCWAVVLAVAIADESYQSIVPGRDSSPWDAVADMVGAVLGSLVFYGVFGVRLRRREERRAQTEAGAAPV